jgi:hypothetical protein
MPSLLQALRKKNAQEEDCAKESHRSGSTGTGHLVIGVRACWRLRAYQATGGVQDAERWFLSN